MKKACRLPKEGKRQALLIFLSGLQFIRLGRLKNPVPFFEIFSGDIKDIAASSLIALFQPLPDFFQRTFYIMNLEFSAQFFRFSPECIPFFSCPESIVKDDVDPTRQYFLTGFPHQLFHNSMTLIVYFVRPVSVKIIAKQFQVPFIRGKPDRMVYLFQPDGFGCFAASRQPDHQMQGSQLSLLPKVRADKDNRP